MSTFSRGVLSSHQFLFSILSMDKWAEPSHPRARAGYHGGDCWDLDGIKMEFFTQLHWSNPGVQCWSPQLHWSNPGTIPTQWSKQLSPARPCPGQTPTDWTRYSHHHHRTRYSHHHRTKSVCSSLLQLLQLLKKKE